MEFACRSTGFYLWHQHFYDKIGTFVQLSYATRFAVLYFIPCARISDRKFALPYALLTQLNVYMQRPFENLIRTVIVPSSSTVVQFWVPLHINRTVYNNI